MELVDNVFPVIGTNSLISIGAKGGNERHRCEAGVHARLWFRVVASNPPSAARAVEACESTGSDAPHSLAPCRHGFLGPEIQGSMPAEASWQSKQKSRNLSLCDFFAGAANVCFIFPTPALKSCNFRAGADKMHFLGCACQRKFRRHGN